MGKKKYGADPAAGVFMYVVRQGETSHSAKVHTAGKYVCLGNHKSGPLAARAVDEALFELRGERPNRAADLDCLFSELDPESAEPLKQLGAGFQRGMTKLRALAAQSRPRFKAAVVQREKPTSEFTGVQFGSWCARAGDQVIWRAQYSHHHLGHFGKQEDPRGCGGV